MDILTSNGVESACQVLTIALVGATLIRLAVSSWLIGRVDEMPGDKKNLFRLDALGSELRREMVVTILYQSLTLLHLPNFGTYMVEKGYIPKSAAKAGLTPRGRLWWVTIKNGEVVTRRILEDNGAINTVRPHPKECYTDASGNLASQIIVCGEGLHDSMAPDECYQDVAPDIKQATTVEGKPAIRTAKPKASGSSVFEKHSGIASSPSNINDPQNYEVMDTDGVKLDDIFGEGNKLLNAGYLEGFLKNLKSFFKKSYDAANIAQDRDILAMQTFIASVESLIESAKNQAMGETFRSAVWETFKCVYPAVTKIRTRGAVGMALGIKFEDLRYALQIYGILSEHQRGMRKDHKLIAIKSSSTAKWLEEKIVPQFRAWSTQGGMYAGYKNAGIEYIKQIADELRDEEGCLNPVDRMVAAEFVMREFMIEISRNPSSEANGLYSMYKWFIEAVNMLRMVESHAMAERDLDDAIGISKVKIIVR